MRSTLLKGINFYLPRTITEGSRERFEDQKSSSLPLVRHFFFVIFEDSLAEATQETVQTFSHLALHSNRDKMGSNAPFFRNNSTMSFPKDWRIIFFFNYEVKFQGRYLTKAMISGNGPLGSIHFRSRLMMNWSLYALKSSPHGFNTISQQSHLIIFVS